MGKVTRAGAFGLGIAGACLVFVCGWAGCAEVSGLSNLVVADAAVNADAQADVLGDDAGDGSDDSSTLLGPDAFPDVWCANVVTKQDPDAGTIDFCADFDEGSLKQGYTPQGVTTWMEMKLGPALALDVGMAHSLPGSMLLTGGAQAFDFYEYVLPKASFYGVAVQLRVDASSSVGSFAGVALSGNIQGYAVILQAIGLNATTFALRLASVIGATTTTFDTPLTGMIGEWDAVSLIVDPRQAPKISATVSIARPSSSTNAATIQVADDTDALGAPSGAVGAYAGSGTLHVDDVVLRHKQ